MLTIYNSRAYYHNNTLHIIEVFYSLPSSFVHGVSFGYPNNIVKANMCYHPQFEEEGTET